VSTESIYSCILMILDIFALCYCFIKNKGWTKCRL